MPCTRVRSASARPRPSSAEPATKPRFQPQPRRKSASVSSPPPSGGARAARIAARPRTVNPARDDRHAAEPVGQAARDRRQREHPERVRRQHEPDGGEPMAVLDEVDRRHGHDQHHHHLPRHERHDRDGHDGPAQERTGRWHRQVRIGSLQRRWVGEGVRLGPQQHERQRERQADEDRRQHEGARELGQSGRLGDGPGRRHEVRTGDRTDRRAPHHRADGRCASPGRHEIRGDVATEVRGAVGEAREEGAEEQQRDRVRPGRPRSTGPRRRRRSPGRRADRAGARCGA